MSGGASRRAASAAYLALASLAVCCFRGWGRRGAARALPNAAPTGQGREPERSGDRQPPGCPEGKAQPQSKAGDFDSGMARPSYG